MTDPMESAWLGIQFWAQAVTEAGTTEVVAVRRAIRSQSVEAPEGPGVTSTRRASTRGNTSASAASPNATSSRLSTPTTCPPARHPFRDHGRAGIGRSSWPTGTRPGAIAGATRGCERRVVNLRRAARRARPCRGATPPAIRSHNLATTFRTSGGAKWRQLLFCNSRRIFSACSFCAILAASCASGKVVHLAEALGPIDTP